MEIATKFGLTMPAVMLVFGAASLLFSHRIKSLSLRRAISIMALISLATGIWLGTIWLWPAAQAGSAPAIKDVRGHTAELQDGSHAHPFDSAAKCPKDASVFDTTEINGYGNGITLPSGAKVCFINLKIKNGQNAITILPSPKK